MQDQVIFQFNSEYQMKLFVKWFQKQGWNNLMLSNLNVDNPKGKNEQLSCLSTDEKMDYGHFFEIE